MPYIVASEKSFQQETITGCSSSLHGIFDFSSVSGAVKSCKQHRGFQRYQMSTNTLCMLFGDEAIPLIWNLRSNLSFVYYL